MCEYFIRKRSFADACILYECTHPCTLAYSDRRSQTTQSSASLSALSAMAASSSSSLSSVVFACMSRVHQLGVLLSVCIQSATMKRVNYATFTSMRNRVDHMFIHSKGMVWLRRACPRTHPMPFEFISALRNGMLAVIRMDRFRCVLSFQFYQLMSTADCQTMQTTLPGYICDICSRQTCTCRMFVMCFFFFAECVCVCEGIRFCMCLSDCFIANLSAD